MFAAGTAGKVAGRVFSGGLGHEVGLVLGRRVDMGAELDIVVRRERGFVVVKATGVIDISTVSRLRERLFEVADQRRRREEPRRLGHGPAAASRAGRWHRPAAVRSDR